MLITVINELETIQLTVKEKRRKHRRNYLFFLFEENGDLEPLTSSSTTRPPTRMLPIGFTMQQQKTVKRSM